MLPIRTFEPGEILRMRDPIIKLEKGAPPAKPVEVEVVKQYPHHLMVKCGDHDSYDTESRGWKDL